MPRQTIITGFKAKAGPKPTKTGNADLDYVAYDAWLKTAFASYSLNGYWDPEKALAYAQARGVTVEKIEHYDTGFMGKAWSRGCDRRFAIVGGVIQPVQV